MRKKRWIMYCCLLFLFFFIHSRNVMAESDTTPPKITGITLPTSCVEAGETVSIKLDVVEEGVGVSWITTNFLHETISGEEIDSYIGGDGETICYSGTIEIPITIPKNAAPGIYRLSYIRLVDSNLNDIRYSENDIKTQLDLDEDLSIMVRNDNYTGPIVDVPHVSELSLKTDDAIAGDKNIEIEFVTDNTTGLDIWIHLRCIDHPDIQHTLHLWNYGSLEQIGENRYRAPFWENSNRLTHNGNYEIFMMYVLGNESGDQRKYVLEDGVLVDRKYGSICQLTGNKTIAFKEDTSIPKNTKVKLSDVSVSTDKVKRPGIIQVHYTVESDYTIANVNASIKKDRITFLGGNDDKNVHASRPVTKASGTITIAIDRHAYIGTYPLYIEAWNIYDGYEELFVGNITIEDEFDVAFDMGVSNPKLLQNIAALKDGETGYIPFSDYNKAIAGKAIFEAIKGRNVNLKFYCSSFEWLFNGLDITDPKDIILTADVRILGYQNYDGSEFQTLNINFADNGVLPGKVQIRLKSDYIYYLHNLTEQLYLFYDNKENGSLDYVSDADPQYIIDGTDHWCYFTITHNSSYILSGKKLYPPKKTTVPNSLSSFTIKDTKTKAIYLFTSSSKKKREVIYYRPLRKKDTKVVIPKSFKYKGITYKVTSIHMRAFYNNKSIRQISIGTNIKTIGTKVFYSCTNLKRITIKSSKLTQKSIGSNAFSKIHKKAIITVPKKRLKAYKKILKKRGINYKSQRIK